MIWLSPMAGTEEGSVYFDIRDIALQSNGNQTQGLIRGLLGDGQQEVWGEVQLGKNPQVRILPVWTEDGALESLSAAVDEELLQQQLLETVQKVIATIGALVGTERTPEGYQRCSSEIQAMNWLAA